MTKDDRLLYASIAFVVVGFSMIIVARLIKVAVQ